MTKCTEVRRKYKLEETPVIQERQILILIIITKIKKRTKTSTADRPRILAKVYNQAETERLGISNIGKK